MPRDHLVVHVDQVVDPPGDHGRSRCPRPALLLALDHERRAFGGRCRPFESREGRLSHRAHERRDPGVQRSSFQSCRVDVAERLPGIRPDHGRPSRGIDGKCGRHLTTRSVTDYEAVRGPIRRGAAVGSHVLRVDVRPGLASPSCHTTSTPPRARSEDSRPRSPGRAGATVPRQRWKTSPESARMSVQLMRCRGAAATRREPDGIAIEPLTLAAAVGSWSASPSTGHPGAGRPRASAVRAAGRSPRHVFLLTNPPLGPRCPAPRPLASQSRLSLRPLSTRSAADDRGSHPRRTRKLHRARPRRGQGTTDRCTRASG